MMLPSMINKVLNAENNILPKISCDPWSTELHIFGCGCERQINVDEINKYHVLAYRGALRCRE